jgi:pyrimidine nucleoside transport protein
VETFLSFALDGAEFVYNKFLVRNEGGVFAFAVLSTIYFFSFCISILYYLGAMQWVLQKLGWILQSIMGTTVCESVNAAANIFLGMSESPLLIRPYIAKLTSSEIHAIMTSGFATVSGTVLAAFINYGAEPAHLITASVMAAPASLCYAKLFYPEIEESKTTSDNIQMEKSTDTSVLDAASNGASQAIPLILNIIANLIAFVSFIALLDASIVWLGELVGAKGLNLEEIFRIVFMPLAYMIGIPWKEAGYVSEIIARKVVVNEFVAFEKLGDFKRKNLIEARSSAIATFAICGFANPSSMGIMIGALSALAPNRRNAVTETAFRAFISATFVCFITASIAGLLMTEDIFTDFAGNNNSTDSDVCV